MYAYNEFDRQFLRERNAQFRDQLNRHLAGELGGDEFKPLRLQNGWYLQRYAPMLRVAVPYGEISSRQLRVIARIAREYDQPDAALFERAQHTQQQMGGIQAPPLVKGVAHFTTRHNIQFNWIPLTRSADVMDLLATVDMHGIQTSGNCIRNITTDELAGVAPDEIADPRPFAEIIRQWSTLHPEFAFLPRKFKIAITGAQEDRAATAWHDVGLHLVRNADNQLGFRVLVGGGMGRTPITGTVVREFLPWCDILNYLEAVVRVYNRWGRRDNAYKARIKILVKAEGQRYIDEVEGEFHRIIEQDGAPHRISDAVLAQHAAHFAPPKQTCNRTDADEKVARILRAAAEDDVEFGRWLHTNVTAHRNPDYRAVTLSFKRIGQAPGDATADQLDAAADLADQFSAGELRITHEQNLVLPWVRCDQLPELWRAARKLGVARPNIGLVSDIIACPGVGYCDLANSRSLPLAAAILERYQDLDELNDLGEIDLHISGCINSCGHHHSGHIGILGVDKDGQEWYQITLGGSDGSHLSGPARAGKVVGPSFAAAEVLGVIEAVLDTYVAHRHDQETFQQTLNRVGFDPFKTAANQARLQPITHA